MLQIHSPTASREPVPSTSARRAAALLPPTHLLQVLERERVRSDRHGCSLALVAFDLGRRRRARSDVRRMAGILQRRLRITDEAGLLRDGRVGVVFPETTEAGAWTAAEGVCRLFSGSPASPRFDVYMYPSDDWPFPEDDGPGPGRRHNGFRDEQSLERLLHRPLPVWKRILDLAGAVTGLVLLAPLILLAAVLIKLTSRGPVLFTQWRAGLGGRPFRIYKLRTMCVDAESRKPALRVVSEQDGPAFKMNRDPRVTPIGRLLRVTSIDELPQLWNVLRGDMSLVGPRPLPCDESDACQRWQRRRLSVTPGLTCIWQVKGRSRVTFAEWIRMDLQYARSRSLMLDLRLLLQTVPAVLLRRGAK